MGRIEDPDRVVLPGNAVAKPMRARGTNAEGRRYWRARGPAPARILLWAGWATAAEVPDRVREAQEKARSRPSAARPAGVRTLRDLITAWQEAQDARALAGQIAPLTLTNYRRGSGHWVAPLGDVLLSELDRDDVEAVVQGWLRDDGYSPRSVGFALRPLEALLRWGAKRGHCRPPELAGLIAIRDDEHVRNARTPTRPEVARVIEVTRAPRRHVLALQAFTGARIGEVAALRVGDWDRDRSVLLLSGRDEQRARRGKTGARAFPVSGELATYLADLAGDRPPTEPLIDGLARGFAQSFLAECERAGVAPFSTHGIRRLVVEELVDRGLDLQMVSRLTGHSVSTLLRLYIRPTPAKLHAAMARVSLSIRKGRKAKVISILGEQVRGTDDESGE